MFPIGGAAFLLRRAVGAALTTVGVALLVVVGVLGFDTAVSQARLAARLEELKAATPDSSTTRRETLETGLVGRIVATRVGLDAMIVEGTESEDLNRGVGHVRVSALPGEPGNIVLAGHRDTFFRGLHGIERGDLVALQTARGVYEYRVDSTFVVRPSRVDVMERAGRNQLTLVTCYPFHWIGSAPMRFVVRARPVAPATGMAVRAARTL